MPGTRQDNVWLLKFFDGREVFDRVCKGPASWNFGISDKLYFFRVNEIILWGKKHMALFQTHNWEKSSFFSTLVRVFARLHANTWQGGGHNAPPLVLIGLNSHTFFRGKVGRARDIYWKLRTQSLEKKVAMNEFPSGDQVPGLVRDGSSCLSFQSRNVGWWPPNSSSSSLSLSPSAKENSAKKQVL